MPTVESPRTPKRAQPEILPLTTLRAVAAGLVFAHHQFAHVPDFSPWYTVFIAGNSGVDIFFALSGFLLTLRYAEEIWSGRFRLRAYLWRRVARIWPLYYFVLFVSVPFGLEINLLNVFFVQGLFDVLWASGISAAWTLTVEEMFYLLLPAILRSLRRADPYLTLIGWVVGMFAAGLALVWLSNQTGIARVYLLSNAGHMQDHTLFGYMFDFAIGIAFALVYRQAGTPNPRLALHLCVSAILGILVCMALITAQVATGASGRFWYYGIAWNAALFMYACTQPRTVIARLMSIRPLVYLGRISYALYLINEMPWLKFGRVFPLPMYYALANGCCVMLYEWVETPAQRFINRRFARR
jgi:peptidoglycan/LPS O-acetylase OafA/YrhL